MKIVFLGGLNIFCYRFAKYYAEVKKYDVHIIIREPENLIHKEWDFVKVHKLNSPRLIKKIFSIRKIIKELNPDVVHTFYLARDSVAPALILKRKFRYIISIFGSDIYHGLKGNVNQAFKLKALKSADYITFNSFEMEKDLIRFFPSLNPDKIKPIIWGVDFEKLHNPEPAIVSELKEQLNLSGKKVILHFRRIGDVYNTKVLCETLPQLVKQYSDVVIIFLLGNYKKNEILDQIPMDERGNVSGQLVLIDHYVHLPELSAYLYLADIVINIPKTDMIAQSLLETLSSRAIPVLSKVPAYYDLIKENENGFYLKDNHPEELLKTIKKVLEIPQEEKNRIVSNNNHLIRDKFNFSKQIEKIIDLYHK